MPLIQYSRRHNVMLPGKVREDAALAPLGASYGGRGLNRGRFVVVTGSDSVDYVYPAKYPNDRHTIEGDEINHIGQILLPAVMKLRWGLSPLPGILIDSTRILWTPEDLSDAQPPDFLRIAEVVLEANQPPQTH